MSLQRRTAEAFQLLELEQLPEEWVSHNWDHNFCETTFLPSQVSQSAVSVETWQGAVSTCREWLAENREQDEPGGAGIWSTLIDCEVSHRSLLALIFCVLDRECQTLQDVECSVCVAQMYLLLLRLPGSTALKRKLFQPIIFQKTLNVFYLLSGTNTAWLDCSGSEGEEGGRGTGRRRVRGGKRGRGGKKGRKRKRRGRGEMMEGEEEDMESIMEESSVDVLSQSSGSGRRALTSQLAVDLLQFTKCCPLASSEETRDQLVQVALHLITQHTTGTTLTTHMLTDSGHSSPVDVLAWKVLAALVLSQQSQAEKITTEIFLQLLPTVLLLSSDGSAHISSTTPPSSLATNNTIVFVSHLVAVCGETVSVPLKGLVHQVCTTTPDRAEYRSKMATVVCHLLALFPDQLYSEMLDWIYRLSRTVKVSHRVFSLEVISELLSQPLREPPEGSLTGEEEYRLSYKFLLKTALSRCSDKAPSVRGRALSCIAASAGSTRSEVVSTLKKCLYSQTTTDPLVAGEKEGVEGLIVPMVRRRTRDEKVGVRKSALMALEAIIRLDMSNVNREDVLPIHQLCVDRALSVRKLALVSLSSLTTDLPQCPLLHKLWLDGVLPMVMDNESSVKEKCISILETIILANISPLCKKQSPKETFVWDLLSLVAEEERMDLCQYIRRAIEVWSKQGKLTANLIKAICSHTSKSTHNKAAWNLLAMMSKHTTTSIDDKFILDNWKSHSSTASIETTAPLVQILTVIGNMTQSLAKAALLDIRVEIVSMLTTFQLSTMVMIAASTTLSQICWSLSKRKNYQTAMDRWCGPLLQKCEQYFSSLIDNSHCASGSGGREVEEGEVKCYMFAVGELCQLSPRQTSSHLALMVHSLLLATRESDGEKGGSHSLSQSSQLPGLSSVTLSPSIRAMGYITLGKLCLQNDGLTKKVIPQLVHELQTSTHAAIRNNIVVVLCDLVVRYSARVDPHIPSIAVCLKDEALVVRKQTLTLLANLVKEDYIKLKGSLFFRFITTLLDEKLRMFAEFFLVHLLLARNPNMFFNHFIECVFHFNGYEKHRVYNRFKQTEREKELFSLAGGKCREQRMRLYTFLLSHMMDTHRFQLMAKLCQEVLGGVADKVIPLDDSISIPVIQDTLAILTSKEIKLSSLRRNMGEELADEGDHAGAVAASAQTKIISQIVKNDVIENVIPIVIAVKNLFEKERSPLLKDLLLCLKEMMQDYRSEVNEILAADKQLAEEIEFDLRRMEEEQKKAARAVRTPLTTTPHTQMVSPLLTPCPARSPGAVFTPPRLRTPTGITGKKTGVMLKTPRIAALKTPLPRIMSPLITHRMQKPPHQVNPPSADEGGAVGFTPQRVSERAPLITEKQREGTQGEGGKEDVTTPAAARARARLVNTSYVPELMTPLSTKTPQVTLKRTVYTTTNRSRPTQTDDTVLHGTLDRVASTPEGLAESISFNVSSVVPPSPIPPTANPDCYLPRRSIRLQAKKSTTGKMADITMLRPEEEPRKLDKWRVKPNNSSRSHNTVT